ncbi:YARHG domain-containing protein [Blautia glucerasea]|uniref:YARHG domain-containing protein n=1 Tax=Blautia glucerasea TaxID=536633 RepID=UPI001D012FAC|nr:YARHG domain-containing protein [Blautia glucerasea]MCB5387387.1 YARHG domain-containing protein [Blautia glucerasea]MCB5421636.1 YARHG domain-containing protein [Blautia luti]
MKKHNKDILKATLFALIAIFVMVGIAGILYANHKKKIQKEQQKKAAIEALEKVPTVTPTPAATATPTPEPTATVTPTPVITRAPAFMANDYLGTWYSKNGLVCLSIDDLTLKSVTFTFSQASDSEGTRVSEASDTAKVAGNAAKLDFTDSWGNQVSGNMTFDQGKLYLRLDTTVTADGAGMAPKVDGVMTREKAAAAATATPTVAAPEESKDISGRDYIFPDSDSRYLTDEDLAGYSSDQLELAKNEIYARHGRKFVTQRIADYFNSKSWYKGTEDPETFDDNQGDIFNEYEVANISKIADTEKLLRSQGK